MSADLTRIKVKLTGTAALLLHNGDLADPLNDYTKRIKAISTKRKKTEDDHAALARVEWEGSLYLNIEGRPCIPGEMLDAVMVGGAKKSKMGQAFKSAVFVEEPDVLIQFDGPRDLEKLYADKRFRDVRGVKVGQARVMRTRPKFPKWSIEFTVTLIPGAGVNPDDVRDALDAAGLLVGIGDFRPRFGRFVVDEFK